MDNLVSYLRIISNVRRHMQALASHSNIVFGLAKIYEKTVGPFNYIFVVYVSFRL